MPFDPRPGFDPRLPYPSVRQPLTADNVVATSVPVAAQAGLMMLRAGGTAADAAVATAACLTVVEPTSNGLGGDAFAILWDGEAVGGYNGSGRSPSRLDAARFTGLDRFPRMGWDPVTTPGAVALWVDLWRRHGRLPFADLLAPAIHYAEVGFLVSPVTAAAWQRAAKRYTDRPDWCATFMIEGAAPIAGQRVKLPGHGRTLRAIAESEGEAFYRGDIARAIDAAARAGGGALRADDLDRHRTLAVDPIAVDYRGATVHELPPNGQGLAALVALGILDRFDLGRLDPDGPDALHLRIEATKLGFADAHRHVADPRFVDRAPAELLAPARLDRLAGLIDRERTTAFDAGVPKPGGTVLLCAADADGCCVAFIQSNYAGFGSGVVVPGWGIAMQNRGACFHLDPGHPNAVAPDKRPYHTIIPGLMQWRGRPTAFGVMGGFMQPQGHVQVVSRMVDHGQNPQAALDAPRHQWMKGLDIHVEPGVDPAAVATLRARGHQITVSPEGAPRGAFGRGQIISALPDGWCAGSDPRADGQAVGF